MFYEILQKKLKNSSNWSSLKDFFMGHAEIRFLHGPCGNQISAWAMWKSDFFSLVQMNFTIFLKMYGNFSMTIAYTNSYRNRNFYQTCSQSKNVWKTLAYLFYLHKACLFKEAKIEWKYTHTLHSFFLIYKRIKNKLCTLMHWVSCTLHMIISLWVCLIAGHSSRHDWVLW